MRPADHIYTTYNGDYRYHGWWGRSQRSHFHRVAQQDREKDKAFHDFKDTDSALALYNQTHRAKVALPQEPKFSDTNLVRSRKMANCCSLARAPSPLATQPFASCKPYTYTCVRHHSWRPNYQRSTTVRKAIGKVWPL